MSRVRRRPRGAATRNRGLASAFKAGKVIKGKRPTKPRALVKTTTRPKPTVKGGRVAGVAKPSVRPKPKNKDALARTPSRSKGKGFPVGNMFGKMFGRKRK